MEAIEAKPKRTRKAAGKYQKHKTDYKITVKHYLNTKLKPDVTSDGKKYYPVYVQIMAKSQKTLRRSLTSLFSTIEDFDQLLVRERRYFEAEVQVIEKKGKATFEKEDDIKYMFMGLMYENQSLKLLVDFQLCFEIISECERYFKDELQLPFAGIKKLLRWEHQEPNNLLHELSDLVPELDRISEKYNRLIPFAPVFNQAFNGFQSRKEDITAFDWQSGFFQEAIRKVNSNEVETILNQMSELLKNSRAMEL